MAGAERQGKVLYHLICSGTHNMLAMGRAACAHSLAHLVTTLAHEGPSSDQFSCTKQVRVAGLMEVRLFALTMRSLGGIPRLLLPGLRAPHHNSIKPD